MSRLGARRVVCATDAPRISLSLLVRHDLGLAHVRLVASNHDGNLGGQILPELGDPLVHLLEGVRVGAIVDNHSALVYGYSLTDYPQPRGSRLGLARGISLGRLCPKCSA